MGSASLWAGGCIQSASGVFLVIRAAVKSGKLAVKETVII